MRSRIGDAGFRVDACEAWENRKSFDEWAAIVADARSMAPVGVVMRALAEAGRDMGIGLRVEDDALAFTHHWRFVRAVAV